MSNTGNKFKIGVLVLLSGVLLIVGLLLLGIGKYFKQSYPFMTVVEGSVQGLEKGAPVKYKGVTIGQVDSVKISKTDENILIYMNFDPDSFERGGRKILNQEGGSKIFEQKIGEQAEKGLRCQLQYQGITGNLYVELSYYDKTKYPMKEYSLPEDHPPFLPSVSYVSVGTIMTNTQDILDKIAKVDFEKISGELESFLGEANAIIRSEKLRSAMNNIETTSKNVSEISTVMKDNFTDHNVKDLLAKFSSSLNDLSKAINEISALASEAKKEMVAANMPETSRSVRELITSGQNTLQDLRELMDAASALINYVEQHPNSLLRGKSDKPVVAP